MADASATIQTELDQAVHCVVMLIGLRECCGSRTRRDNHLFGNGTGWHRETVNFEIIRKKNEGNLQNFI
jgi:hypothetical protein